MKQPSEIPNKSTQQPHATAMNGIATEDKTIPVIEERMHLGKEVVEKGNVRIRKVVTEQEVPVNIPLLQEGHDIQRIPVNQYVETPPPPIRYEGDTMIIPILQEVMVIEKRLLVVEELHITKHLVHTQNIQHVHLRKEEIRIERTTPNSPDTIGDTH